MNCMSKSYNLETEYIVNSLYEDPWSEIGVTYNLLVKKLERGEPLPGQDLSESTTTLN
eukprot:Pgem_evm1s5593